MARIASASTVTVSAHITEIGRRFLLGFDNSGENLRFEDGVDLFEITDFSLHDTDVNYRVIPKLESGDVPDLSGTGSEECLKTFSNTKDDSNKQLFF